MSFTWKLNRDNCPRCKARFSKVGVIFEDGTRKKVKVSHKKLVLGKEAKTAHCLNCGRDVELLSEANIGS